jgi:hypothetical protein
VDWIYLAQDGDQWVAVVCKVINFEVHKRRILIEQFRNYQFRIDNCPWSYSRRLLAACKKHGILYLTAL